MKYPTCNQEIKDQEKISKKIALDEASNKIQEAFKNFDIKAIESPGSKIYIQSVKDYQEIEKEYFKK